MNINIPDTMKRHAPFLKEFFEGMVFKLHVNSFKDDTEEKDVPGLIDAGLAELAEFREQLEAKRNDPNSLHELFDMSNFNYLLFWFLRNNGVPDEREQFIDEFLDVDTISGKVYAKKSRSGSRYTEGEEIKGTLRSGKVYIRIQHAVTGAMISCARCDIVWFKETGEWPESTLKHENGDVSNDSFENLRQTENNLDGKLPFVFEHEINDTTSYGYQRRHRGVLLRVGYWATEMDAASKGIAAWKERVKEMENV